MNNYIYFIVGPTCIGKSTFAKKLAKKINGEIINADSMQVYKDLRVLTARPSEQETKEVNHHLYGHVESIERYNVAKWCNEASIKIKEFKKKNIYPVLVGGTGLYVDKLINGIMDIPAIPETIKEESDKIFLKEGRENFFNKVKKIDTEYIKEINKNDILRLKRILEVFLHTGKNITFWKKHNYKFFLDKNTKYNLLLFLPNRKINYERVNERFINMISNGAIDEVKTLLKKKLNQNLPVLKAHGVPEITLLLENKITQAECIEKSQKVTRNYVKRQHTWWNATNLEIFMKFNQFPDEIDINLIKFNRF